MDNKKRERVVIKPVSLHRKEIEKIKNELGHYGDFTGFVRYCLKKDELIKEYLAQ